MRDFRVALFVALSVSCAGPPSEAQAADDAGHELSASAATPSVAERVADADTHASPDYNRPPLTFDAPLFLFTLVLFGLFLFLARRLAWRPLIDGLDAREARIHKALEDAKAARSQAEELLQQHQQQMAAASEEVRGIVAAARREAEQSKAEIIAQAEAEAEEIRNRALADIDAAREQVLAELSGTIDQYAETTTSRMIGR